MSTSAEIAEVIAELIGQHEGDLLAPFRGPDWRLSGGRIFRNVGKFQRGPRVVVIDAAAVATARRQHERALWERGLSAPSKPQRAHRTRAQLARPHRPYQRAGLSGAVDVLLDLRARGYAHVFPQVVRHCFPGLSLLAIYRAVPA